MMIQNYCIIFGLILTIHLAPIRAESDQKDNTENIEVKTTNPLESKKADAILENNDENIHEVTESRVERSSEVALDDKIANSDVKTTKNDEQIEINLDVNSRRSTSGDTDKKSTGFDNESDKPDFNLNSDDVANERSLINNDEDIDEYSIDDMEKAGNDDELTDKDGENEELRSIDTLPDSTRSGSHEAQDAILDHKARTAQKLDDIETKADSSEVNDNFKVLGSRRSFSNEPSRDGLVSVGRTGNIFNDDYLSNNQNPLQFTKIMSSETFMPNAFGSPPLPVKFNDFGPKYLPQKPYEITSSESKPLEEFNFNPFSNSYPYAYNPKPISTTTPKPIDFNNFLRNPSELFPKFPPSPSINRNPKYGDNFQPFYPITIRPMDTKLSLPNFGVPRLNRYPNIPYFYRTKCSMCA